MDLTDPDLVAQLYVMQWMHENGLHDALRALEKQLRKVYDDTQVAEASQLMQLVWRHVEERLQEQEQDEDDDGRDDAAAPVDKGPSSPSTVGTNTTTTTTTSATRRRHQEESLRLLRAGGDDYAGRTVVAEVPPEVHHANIIAVRLVPGRDQIITGTGDGIVRCVRYSPASSASSGGVDSGRSAGQPGGAGGGSEVLWATRVGAAAVLSLALHPAYSSGLPLVAAGTMDGRVAVLHGPSGSLLTASQAHSKYVVRVAWGGTAGAEAGPASVAGAATAVGPEQPATAATLPATENASGSPPQQQQQQQQTPVPLLVVVSGSTDETVVLQRLELSPDVGPGAVLDGGEEVAEAPPAGCGKLVQVKQIPYGAAVTDVAFLRDGRTLVVGVRGSNYLRLLDTGEVLRQQLAAGGPGSSGGGPPVPEVLVNLNEAGDDHVSFSAKHLVTSPCGAYLLVCTDSPRLLVLRTSDWSHLRLMFGLPVDQFPQPAAAWHRDSHYLYVSGANAQLCVFHLGSGRLVASSRPHRVNLRDLDYDPDRNLLATCSFDKTVKVLGASNAGQEQGQAGSAAAGVV